LRRGIKTGTGATGRVKALSFIENAYNATEEQIYNMMAEEWYREIDRMIVRVNKKAK
jgi:hypothetical protein